jgi:hypothetical protein
MQRGEQGGVDQKGFRIAYQLAEDLPAQGLQKAPELPHPAVQRGRVKPHDPGEQVGEEPLSIAQKGALGLHASKLLQEGKGYDLRVREPLYGFVASPFRVEEGVGVVDEAKQDGEGLFRSSEPLGMVGLGHQVLLREGRLRWPSFYSQSTQHSSRVERAVIHPSAWKRNYPNFA